MATNRYTTILACTGCKERNYTFGHAKKKQYKLEIKKFCERCGKCAMGCCMCEFLDREDRAV